MHISCSNPLEHILLHCIVNSLSRVHLAFFRTPYVHIELVWVYIKQLVGSWFFICTSLYSCISCSSQFNSFI